MAEPEVQFAPDSRLSVKRGTTTLVGTGRPLYDYFTLANLLQPCAALVSTTNVFNSVNTTLATNRCNALKANGVPPTIGINIVNNNSVGGPLLDAASLSIGGVMDYNIAGALCMRELAVGTSANALRVQQGMNEVVRSANLRGKPAIIVQGRSDTLLPVAFTGRPYFGMNKIVEGANSKLSYIEVANAQHFDAFLSFPGYADRLVPLHRYFIQAMDMMYANLKNRTALPESQVVRTTPRGLNGAVANPITAANVPSIKVTADAADRISFANNIVTVAD